MRPSYLPLVLVLAACPPRAARPTAAPAPDPRVAVTEWSQVARYHCARGPDGAPRRCTLDGECPSGTVCDTSSGCGCCVAPPPRLEPGATLHRYLFTACDGDRCAPPPYCIAAADGASCTMRFDREVPLWATPWEPPQGADALVEARRAMCIRVEPAQRCLWAMELPGGQYAADEPFPIRYQGTYECGGRTCNGRMAVRASPRVGASLTARVVARHCSQ